VRVGILQTDSVLPELRQRFGDYPDMFERVLRQATTGPLQVRTFDVQGGLLPEPAACDGYLITGSKASVYDDLPWLPPLVAFIHRAVAARRPVVGICFGHQLLAHGFGGRVGPAAAGWAVGVHHSRVHVQLPWMDPPLESFALLSSHKDQVEVLPPDARLFAGSDFCPVGGFVSGEYLLALQGHPEFVPPYAQALLHKRRELLGPQRYQQGLESLETPTDAGQVARWILNFIGRGEGA
jgi:GMP synthase-like glutamine amidotransferase